MGIPWGQNRKETMLFSGVRENGTGAPFVTTCASPRATSIMINEMTIGCTLNFAMINPLKAPTAIAAIRATIMEGTIGVDIFIISCANIVPVSAIVAPTEMSIPPEDMTKVIPSPVNMIGQDCMTSSQTVLGEKKFLVNMQLSAKAVSKKMRGPNLCAGESPK
jgi:hypothetical protein